MRIIFSLLLLLCSMYTTAAQHNWHVLHLDNTTEFRGSDYHSGVFWLAGSGSRIFKSVDSGKSWQDVSIKTATPLDFRDIEALDANTAIAMSAGTGNKSQLFVTHNQGETWQALYQNQDAQGFFNSIDFWDKNNGILMGDPVDGYFVIMTTSNGGKNWQRVPRANLPELQKDEAAFAASGNTIITGPNKQVWFATGGLQASVYYSQDMGVSWHRTYLPITQQTHTSGVYALTRNKNNEVFALGGDYKARNGQYVNMAVLTKHTKNWVIPNIKQQGLLTAMQCIGKTCVATGKLTSYISYNNGKRWSELKSQGQVKGFYTITAAQGVFIGAGAKGSIGILTTH